MYTVNKWTDYWFEYVCVFVCLFVDLKLIVFEWFGHETYPHRYIQTMSVHNAFYDDDDDDDE